MNRPREETRLYHAMRIKDPTIRKQCIENVEKDTAYSRYEPMKKLNFYNMFEWGKTPQGADYWSKIKDQYHATPSLLADEPIEEDELPDEYWIENTMQTISSKDSEFVILFNKEYNENIGGTQRYYKVENEKSGCDYVNEVDDGLPIIPYETWKAAIQKKHCISILPVGEVVDPKVGEWVCIIDNEMNKVGVHSSLKRETAYQVEERSEACIQRLSGIRDTLQFSRFRYATQQEIDAAQKKEPDTIYSTLQDYSIEAIKGKKIVVHCPTQEEWDKVWKLGQDKCNSWVTYGKESCVRIEKLGDCTYGTAKNGYEGYQIIPATKVIEWNEKKVVYKAGDWVVWLSGPGIARQISTYNTTRDWYIWYEGEECHYTHNIYDIVRPATQAEIDEAQGKVEKLAYQVGQWVVITKDMGADPVGTITEVLRKDDSIANPGSVWVKEVVKKSSNGTGWFQTPDTIRPATEEEIKKATRKKLSFKTEDGYDIPADNTLEDFIWVFSDGSDGNHTRWDNPKESFCNVVETHKGQIERQQCKVFKSKEAAEKWVEKENERLKLIHQKPATTEEAKPAFGGSGATSTSKKYKVGERVIVKYIDGNGVPYSGGYATIVPDNTTCSGKLKDEKSVQYVVKMDKREDYHSESCYRVQEEAIVGRVDEGPDVTELIKQSYPWTPQRKWKVGDRFWSKYNGKVYTIEENRTDGEYVINCEEEGVESEWYSPDEIDELFSTNAWIPYNPEPVIVSEENAHIGMKVVRGRDWKWDDQDGKPGNIGEIIEFGPSMNVSDGWVRVKWDGERAHNYRIRDYYDLYVANENTTKQSIINNNSKTQKHDTSKKEHTQDSCTNNFSDIKAATYIRTNPEVTDGQGYCGGKVSAATYKVQPTSTEGYY